MTSQANDRAGSWMRWIARVLSLLCGAWWTFFGVASGLAEGLDPVGILIHAAVPGLILLISALIAWRWERVGGALLALEGLVVLVGYPLLVRGRFPISTVVFMLLTMAAPLLIPGLLFLVTWRRAEAQTIA